MRMFFDVTNQTLTQLPRGKVVADSQDYLYAKFRFTDDWDDEIKIAQFRRDDLFYSLYLDENNEVKVPWEVLEGEGSFFLNVYGNNQLNTDNKIITTNQLEIQVCKSGLTPGELPLTPTEGIEGSTLHRILIAEQNAGNSATAAANSATAAYNSKTQAEQSVSAAAGSAIAAASSATAANTSRNEASNSAIAAASSAANADASKTAAIEAQNTAVSAKNEAVQASTSTQAAVVEADNLLEQYRALIAASTVNALWSASTTYNTGDCVMTTNGVTYRCLQTSTNNPPATSPAYWTAVQTTTLATFEHDGDGDLMPRINPANSAFWEIDSDGDITPV